MKRFRFVGIIIEPDGNQGIINSVNTNKVTRTKRFKLGTVFIKPDGARYRYVHITKENKQI